MTDSSNLKLEKTIVSNSDINLNNINVNDITVNDITVNDKQLDITSDDKSQIILEDTTESLIDYYMILKKLSIDYIKDYSFKKEKYPLLVTFYINESLKLNLSKEEILDNLNRFGNENLSEYKTINFMEINQRLVETRFSVSKINETTKITHIKNRNIILNHTLRRIKQFIKNKDIDINNIVDNIYEIIEDTITLVNQYDIKEDDKRQVIVKVITNIIENIIKERIDLTIQHNDIIKNIKYIQQYILPYYIESFINEDLNEDVVIKTKKYITKLLSCCLLKK